MNDKDRAEFAVLIGATAELYGRSLTPAAIELWWNDLKDLSLQAVRFGLSSHRKDPTGGHFMPTPADVRRTAAPPKPSALIAWSEVLDAMEKHGAYQSVLFEDGVINAVIRDLGGWPQLCYDQMHEREEIWIQKEFERRYSDYAGVGRVVHEALEGVHDQENRNRGYLEYVKPPALIQSQQQLPALQDGSRLKLKAVPNQIGPAKE